MSIALKRAVRTFAASSLATVAGGALDAWVYLGHGHTFANAQTGNIVLMCAAAVQGYEPGVACRLPSLIAFVVALFLSRAVGEALKKQRWNSRTARLSFECLLLVTLAAVADRWSDQSVSAFVGFIAALQITSLSHVASWSFNTGMTTGNLRGAATAATKALFGDRREMLRSVFLSVLCVSFALGAAAGAWLTPRLHAMTLLPIAVLIASVIVTTAREPDPLSDWTLN